MALKGDRIEPNAFTDLHFFMNEVAERGGVVSVSTGASGASLDNSLALATYKANSSGGLPLGVLVNDMVSIDQTRQHINFYRDEVQIGGKVCLLRKGQVLTNMVTGTPSAGQFAILSSSGTVAASATFATLNLVATPVVGQWLSAKDADGYAVLSVDL